MKSIAALTLSVAGVAIAAPAFAASGYAGGGFVQTEVDAGPFEVERDGFFVDGAVAFPLERRLGMEVSGTFADLDDEDGVALSAHLFRAARDWRLGGFVGFGDAGDADQFSVGGAGVRYFRDVTLGAALGYVNVDDSDADGFGLDGVARYFVSPNFRLDGRLAWTEVDGPSDGAFSIGAGGEFQLAELPVSVFGGYRRTDFDEGGAEVSTVQIGVRYNWGGTLKERDRTGVSLTGVSSLASGLGAP